MVPEPRPCLIATDGFLARHVNQPMPSSAILFGHTGHTISDSVTAVRLKVANSVPNVTEAGGYDVRYGPGHRPRVITKAVGDRDGVGTMGRPGP